MGVSILICAFLLVSSAVSHPSVESNKVKRDASNDLSQSLVGAGYSEDTQQIVPQKCYNSKIVGIDGQQSRMKLDTATSSADLEKDLDVSLSIGGKYQMFSASVKASYVRNIKEKSYSISVNYYNKVTSKVRVGIEGFQESILNDNGKLIYDHGNNPYFGLVCGDNYITEYEQGALIIMGLNIEFRSAEDKEKFSASVGVKFADIVDASVKVEGGSKSTNVSGAITIHAFQLGGEPSELSKILSRDDKGDYFALTCSLTDMEKCKGVAKGLLDYARTELTAQLKDGKGLTTEGVASVKFNPIDYLRLNKPKSFVTDEVKKIRNDLAAKYLENQSYLDKLHPVTRGGKTEKLDEATVMEAHKLEGKAEGNIASLMQPHGGALDCYNFPDRCKVISEDLFRSLASFSEQDLQFINGLKGKI